MKPKEPECSECYTGQWQAPFPKKNPDEMGLLPDPHHPGFYTTQANIDMVAKERRNAQNND